MADIRLADISEWQPNFDAPAYLKSHACIILRSHSGNRPDKMFPARRDYVRKYNFTAVGYYQYMVASRSATDQANDFVKALGPLKANEFAVIDSEEGSGSQVQRCEDWCKIVDKQYGQPSVIYASESWFKDKLGGVDRWKGRARWIAAYRSTEPTVAHELWQNTDSASFPGLGSPIDGNLFHGTAQEFLTKMRGSASSPAPPKPPPGAKEEDVVAILKQDGRIVLFVQKANGQVMQAYQTSVNGPWKGADETKKAKWYGLGNPGK